MSLMTMALVISRKFCRCAVVSSCAFPLNSVVFTMLMGLGLSSNSKSLVSNVGPMWIFSMLRIENFHRALLSITLKK